MFYLDFDSSPLVLRSEEGEDEGRVDHGHFRSSELKVWQIYGSKRLSVKCDDWNITQFKLLYSRQTVLVRASQFRGQLNSAGVNFLLH